MSNIEIKTKKIISYNYLTMLIDFQNAIREGWYLDPSQAGIVNIAGHYAVIVKRGEKQYSVESATKQTDGGASDDSPNAEFSSEVQDDGQEVVAPVKTSVKTTRAKTSQAKTTRAKTTQE